MGNDEKSPPGALELAPISVVLSKNEGHISEPNSNPTTTSLLSIFPGVTDSTEGAVTNDISLQWYKRWLERQTESIPHPIAQRLPSVPAALLEIANSAKGGVSIDDIVTNLLHLELFESQDTDDEIYMIRSFVVAVVGWQTMLYQPSFDTCPPEQLAIGDALDGYLGQAFMTLKQDHARTRRNLWDFLLGFGLLLPRPNLCISDEKEDRQAFDKCSIINSNEFNAALLQSLARIKIKWVDVMAPHLEFDKPTNTLFLFRYPSFCVANIPLQGENNVRGPIYACAAENGTTSEWASEMDITQFLHEVLLSYRLLFGQDKSSRKVFLSMNPFQGVPGDEEDPLLTKLCTCKIVELPVACKEQDFYRLNRDFPILRSRIASLHQQMTDLKPRGWKELWRDRRDSAHWYTFWAVIILGGFGLFFSFLQVVLQALQLAGIQ